MKYTRYKIAVPRRSLFERAYGSAAEPLVASPHCLAYELADCSEDPEHYILRIERDSEEGPLKGFRSSPEFQTFFGLVKAFVKDIDEMRHYNVLSANRKSK